MKCPAICPYLLCFFCNCGGPAERTVYQFTRTVRKLRAKFRKGTLTLSNCILNLVKKNELDAVGTKSTSVDIHNLSSSREQLSLIWRHMTSNPPQKNQPYTTELLIHIITSDSMLHCSFIPGATCPFYLWHARALQSVQ